MYWQCVVRNKDTNCEAIVKEIAENYIRVHNPHCHPSEACPAVMSKISVFIKEKAVEDVFRLAANIMDEVLHSKVDPNKPLTSLPAPENLSCPTRKSTLSGQSHSGVLAHEVNLEQNHKTHL